jgi:hypothetical protein
MAVNVWGNWRVGCVSLSIIGVMFGLMVWTVGLDMVLRISAVLFVLQEFLKLQGLARASGARAGGAAIAIGLVAVVAFAWLMLVWDVRWWVRWLLAPTLTAPLMSIANAAYRDDVRQAQRLRGAEATRLTGRVLAGEHVEPFVLYLRPFATANRLPALPWPRHNEVLGGTSVHLDVETLLARAFRDTMPVIALGPGDEMLDSSGRAVVTNENWREAVQALARQAGFITMVPLPTPSTMWELEWLMRSGLLDKVLFVMPETPFTTPRGIPPAQHDDRVFDVGVRRFEPAQHDLDLPMAWSEILRRGRELGLEFPPLAAVGALYTMTPAGTLKDIVPLGLTTSARPLEFLRTSVSRLGMLAESEASSGPLETIERFAVYDDAARDLALTRAADGFIAWGDVATALRLIHRALETGRPGTRFAAAFIEQLPLLIDQRVTMGDAPAAANYRAFGRLVLADIRLSQWASIGELNRRLASVPLSRS